MNICVLFNAGSFTMRKQPTINYKKFTACVGKQIKCAEEDYIIEVESAFYGLYEYAKCENNASASCQPVE